MSPSAAKPDPRLGDLRRLAACAREVEREHPAQAASEDAHEREPMLASLGPWLGSFVLHALLVVIAVGIIWSIPLSREDDPIIPSATLGPTRGTPLEAPSVRRPMETAALDRSSRTVTPPPSPLTAAAPRDRSLIGVLGQSASDAALFTPPPPPAGGEVKFYGLSGGNARKVVWVVDASGGMIDTLPFVLKELARAVEGLSAEQSFSIVFFQRDEALEAPPAGLKVATPANRRAALAWAGRVVPRGTSNPIRAIQAALEHRPDLIYLLSDNITGAGRFEIDREQLLREIARVNTAGTKINTIQFIYRDPLEQAGMKPTLELLAESTGGQYRFLSRADLGLE